jgi:hypothetical protein
MDMKKERPWFRFYPLHTLRLHNDVLRNVYIDIRQQQQTVLVVDPIRDSMCHFLDGLLSEKIDTKVLRRGCSILHELFGWMDFVL